VPGFIGDYMKTLSDKHIQHIRGMKKICYKSKKYDITLEICMTNPRIFLPSEFCFILTVCSLHEVYHWSELDMYAVVTQISEVIIEETKKKIIPAEVKKLKSKIGLKIQELREEIEQYLETH